MPEDRTRDLVRRRLTLEHMRIFNECATNTSFAKAADALGLAQPQVTKRISELEQHLGLKLFDRGARGASLTTAGAQLLERTVRVLNSTERLIEHAQNISTGDLGALSIACYPVHVERMLGRCLGEFARTHPRISVDLTQMRDDRRRRWGRSLFEELRDGEVDLAIGPPHTGDGLDGFQLYVANIVALVPADDPHRHARFISIEHLRERLLLIAPPRFFSREVVATAAREAQFELNAGIQSSNPPALLVLGREGLGIPVVPDDYPLVGQQVNQYPCVTKMDGTPLQTPVWVHWRDKEARTPAVEAFVALLRSAASAESNEGRLRETYYHADLSAGTITIP